MFGAPAGGGLFGAAQPSGGGLFGAQPAAPGGGGLFGAAQPAASGGGLFGAAPAPAAGGGLFGAAPAPAAGGGLFGAAPASGGGGLFGAAPAAASGGGLFGAAPAAAPGGGLFGAAQTSGGGLFGAAPAAAGGGLFGAAPAAAGGGLFGAAAATSGGGLFGAAPAPAGGGLFGAAPASGGGLFGAQAQTSGGGLFGAPAASAGAGQTGGGLFGSTPHTQGLGSTSPQDAMMICMELAKRLEELYPTLQRASGQAAQAQGGAAPSALQQGFVAFTYSFGQANVQFNPQQHVDYAKFAQAVQTNPDPMNCYPEALVGLQALEARAAQQYKAFEDCTTALEELKAGFGNLKDALQVQSLQKLDECRRRHQKLSNQLLQVVAATESYAVANGAAHRNPNAEAQLETRLAQLEEQVNHTRLEELWVVLRGLLQRSPPSGGGARLGDAEAEKALRITASQGELLEMLQEELARRKRDVGQFESALARFATSMPVAGAQSI